MINSVPSTTIELTLPSHLAQFTLPEGVRRRLDTLLDRQDQGQVLSAEESMEAEGLVDLAEFLSLLKLRAQPSDSEKSKTCPERR